MLPIFQKLDKDHSISSSASGSTHTESVTYGPGLCPVTEDTNKHLLIHELMRPPMNAQDLNDVISAFVKVFDNLDTLRNISPQDKVRPT